MAYQGSSTASSPSRASKEPATIFPIPPTQRDDTQVDSAQQLASSRNLSSHFTQSQLTLALAIQKSKPVGASANEYYMQLQIHRKPGRAVLGANRRYIETSEFWKDQFSKVHQEKKDLEKKVYLLEERQRQLANLSFEPEQDNPSSDPRKRPAKDQEIGGCIERQQRDAETLDQDLILTLSSYIIRVARQQEKLRKHTKVCKLPTDIDNLSTLCIQSTSLLEAAVSDCSTPLWSLKCDADRQVVSLVEQLMRQISQCFEACFIGLNELCQTILGRKKKYDVVHHIISFFGKALDNLQTLCSIQTEHEIEKHRQRGHRRGIRKTQAEHPSKRARTNGEDTLETENEEYAINRHLTIAIESTTYMQWNAGQPGHRDILEGMLFFILEHTGRLVSNAVFNEHVAASNRPGNISKNGSLLPPEFPKLETRYMIKILSAALGTSSTRRDLVAHVLAEETPGASCQINSRTTSEHTRDILAKAREKIQSSLLKSVVGGEVAEGLTIPKPISPGVVLMSSLAMDGHGEKYGMDWLLGSVWALVGWETMAR